MTNWKEYKLGEILTVLTDYHANGAYTKLKANVTLKSEVDYSIMIRTTNFEQKNFENLIYVDKHAFNFLSKSKVYTGDIIMNKIANAGSIYLMPNLNKPVTLGMNLFLLRVDESKANQIFTFYYLKNNEPYIKSFASGSVTKTITKEAVRQLKLVLPDLSTQTVIAEILSSLDDKIELNNKINQELENLAQTLFKQWFIDFEFPNENGEPYKSSGGEMVDSELGEIPKGWEVKTLSEIVSLTGGGTPKRSNSEYWDEGQIPWFSVQDVPSQSEVVVIDTKEKITVAGLNNSSTKILPVGTTIITARGTVGKLAFVAVPMAMNQSCYGVNGKQGIGEFFNYLNLSKAVQELKQNTHGAVFDTITSSTFQTIKTILPDSFILEEFETLIEPLFLTIETNARENQELTNLRDTLLPKLISGELEVNGLNRDSLDLLDEKDFK